MDITMIFRGGILILAGLFMIFVIPILKGKLNSQQMETLYTIVTHGVHAAEQIYYSNQGKEKKQYVLDYLREHGYKVDDEALEMEFKTLIEAAVKELRIEQGQQLNAPEVQNGGN